MPIERYSVGRSYTKRTHIVADFADPDAVRAVMETLAAADHTLEGRLADVERRARAYLTRANKPLDPSEPPYANPAWRRANERKSLTWYSINILNTIRMLRLQIERGETRFAADLALDLGVLAAEAVIVQDRVGGSIRGGEGVKDSTYRLAIEERNTAWRAQAVEMWRGPRRKYGALAIAKLINPTRFERVRKVIADLKPR